MYRANKDKKITNGKEIIDFKMPDKSSFIGDFESKVEIRKFLKKIEGTKKYMNVNERVTRTTRARATIKKTLRNIYTELSFQRFTLS